MPTPGKTVDGEIRACVGTIRHLRASIQAAATIDRARVESAGAGRFGCLQSQTVGLRTARGHCRLCFDR